MIQATTQYGAKHQRLKHVLRRVSKVNEWLLHGVFKLVKIGTEFNFSDIFTKRLSIDKFELFRTILLSDPRFAPWVLPEAELTRKDFVDGALTGTFPTSMTQESLVVRTVLTMSSSRV